jgi:hypothetical protein
MATVRITKVMQDTNSPTTITISRLTTAEGSHHRNTIKTTTNARRRRGGADLGPSLILEEDMVPLRGEVACRLEDRDQGPAEVWDVDLQAVIQVSARLHELITQSVRERKGSAAIHTHKEGIWIRWQIRCRA